LKTHSRYKLAVDNFERVFILNAVENHGGDLVKASKWLGLDYGYLKKKVQRFKRTTAL
jgi:DNA-binding protein Fis